jgi:hypothetical protein
LDLDDAFARLNVRNCLIEMQGENLLESFLGRVAAAESDYGGRASMTDHQVSKVFVLCQQDRPCCSRPIKNLLILRIMESKITHGSRILAENLLDPSGHTGR